MLVPISIDGGGSGGVWEGEHTGDDAGPDCHGAMEFVRCFVLGDCFIIHVILL